MKPRIKRTTERFEAPEGDVYLLRPSTGGDIRIGEPSEEDRRLLAALDGSRTVAELNEEFGADAVGDALSQLGQLEAIEDAEDDERVPAAERARYESQLRYFSDVGGRELPPSECQRRLREARVAVLGVGGLGSWAAWSIACCGVGEIWLIDGDRVELSNLNRQIFYTEADIGLLKAEIAGARLRAFNPAGRYTATTRRLESKVEIADFIDGADVVIDAADWPAHDIEHWCNAACFELGIPYITMSHFPPVARVGPLFVPGRTGCYACQEAGYRREYTHFDAMVEQLRGRPSPSATLGPACGLIGGLVGLEVMHLLTGLAEPATLGVAQMYDLRTLKVKSEPVVPDPDCPLCGHLQPAEPAEPAEAGVEHRAKGDAG